MLASGGCWSAPGWQLHGQVGRDAPGEVHVVLPLLLAQADVLGPPVGHAALPRLVQLQLRGGQRVVPGDEALDLGGLGDGQGQGCASAPPPPTPLGPGGASPAAGQMGTWLCPCARPTQARRASPAVTAAASGASCNTCAAGSPGWSSWTCLGRGGHRAPSEALHDPEDPRDPGEKPHRPDFLEMVDMPLDSGYVFIQPCVACWREPTAMSRLLRVSWLSAGRHSIPEQGTWTFRMDEAATGAQTGETASESQAPGNSGARLQHTLPTARGAPRAQSTAARAPPAAATGHLPPGVLPHRGPALRGVRSHWDTCCDCRPVLWQAACVGLPRRPRGPSCCRQGPDPGVAPTIVLESLPTGLPRQATMDHALSLVAHRPQPRLD